jgi:hypothetical protein
MVSTCLLLRDRFLLERGAVGRMMLLGSSIFAAVVKHNKLSL